ncbi:hypothetical protein CVT26_002253 [Gymnopilus dilepis]|uniref:Uncharacterized protein n=1 Tax=Gymnopilus dilepis TaxID=231916 RepID=A0A409YN85_9AGAR|nr:hypothetical protein CVT26_002253 [Gymnopilus dilepis]
MAALDQLRLVFLDDNHPIMEYSDGWSLSVLTPAEEPQSFTPFYDSLHVTTQSPSSTRYNVSFTFDAFATLTLSRFTPPGTFVSAVFGSGTGTEPDAIKVCAVDGVLVPVYVAPMSGQIYCQTDPTQPLGAQEHQVEIEVIVPDAGLAMAFDGVYYAPTAVQNAVGDVVYQANDTNITSGTDGMTLDFDFTGYSLTMYASFSFGEPTLSTILSYAIDDDPPQNITITNAADAVTKLVSKRVLQTAAYPSCGQHHLHLVSYGTNETVPFKLDQIIVQSTVPNVPLQTFPSASSATAATTGVSPAQTSTQQTSLPSTKSHIGTYDGIIIGCAIVVLILAFGIIFYWRRKRNNLNESVALAGDLARVEPFEVPSRPRSRWLVGKGAANTEGQSSSNIISRSERRSGYQEDAMTQIDVPPDYISLAPGTVLASSRPHGQGRTFAVSSR